MITPSSLSENKKFHYDQSDQLHSFLVFCSVMVTSNLLQQLHKTRYGLQWFITVSLFGLMCVARDGLHPSVIEKREYHRRMGDEYHHHHSLSTLVNRD